MDAGDSELVLRCLWGDRAAFDPLYRAHAGRVKTYFLRCGFPEAFADDLTQDVFVRVLKSLHTFNPARGTFRQWLAAVTRNVARRRWERRADPESFDPELAEETLATYDNPGAASEEGERMNALGECVRALPPDLARLVRLRYVEGRTTRGIAAAVRMAEATVRLRLAEATDMLRRCMKSKGLID